MKVHVFLLINLPAACISNRLKGVVQYAKVGVYFVVLVPQIWEKMKK